MIQGASPKGLYNVNFLHEEGTGVLKINFKDMVP